MIFSGQLCNHLSNNRSNKCYNLVFFTYFYMKISSTFTTKTLFIMKKTSISLSASNAVAYESPHLEVVDILISQNVLQTGSGDAPDMGGEEY